MNLGKLASLVEAALDAEPTPDVRRLCGEYYSPYYNLFYLLAASLPCPNSVELGVETGRGSGSLALGNPGGEVFGFDNQEREEALALARTLPNFHFLHRPSLPANPGKFVQPIHILHVDTEHSYAQAQAEFEAYRPYLAEGAVICFDDLHAQDDAVLRFFYGLPHPKIQDDRLHPVCGYGVRRPAVLLRPAAPQDSG